MQNKLLRARTDRGWSQYQLLQQLRLAADAAGYHLPETDTLRVTLSGWENGRHRPGEMYKQLLCRILEMSEADLGFGAASAPRPTTSIGQDVVIYLDSMFDMHTGADRLLGSELLLAVVREQTRQAEALVEQSRGSVRESLLGTVSRYAEFCGWVHQDQGDFVGADQWTRRSIELAQEVGDAQLVAYALMRRSNIATDAGRPNDGLHLAEAALRQGPGLAPRVRALSLRQKATAHALRGESADCLDAIHRGIEAVEVGDDASHGSTRYCTVSYMAMEGGQALSHANRPAHAVQLLTEAIQTWPPGQDRDLGLCQARLANAYVEVKNPEAACVTAIKAVETLRAAPSARTASVLRQLRGRLTPYRRRPDVMDLREQLAQAV